MSQALDRVRSLRELPIFPLPLVHFPYVPLPLHIFEPRYRRMLDDVRAANNLFGLSHSDSEAAIEGRPPEGHIGCATEVVEVQTLPDGRSNILTIGVVRYRVEEYIERGDPYIVARVEFFEDEEEDARLLTKSAGEVADLFRRITLAMRTISGERAAPPELPVDEPERLSFLVAAVIEMDAAAKQELLEMRSTSRRLRRLDNLLSQAVGNYEARARVHEVSKGNGHARSGLNIEE